MKYVCARRATLALATLLSACTTTQVTASAADIANCNQLKDIDQAIAGCTAVIGATPRDAGSLARRGFANFLKEEYDLARSDFDAAIRIDPRNPEAFARRGLIWRVKGEDARAIEDFSRAIELNFNDPNVFVDRGVARLAQGDTSRAVADFTTAIERDADKTFVSQLGHIMRGVTWLYSGSPSNAQLDLLRATELNPKEPFFALFLHIAERRTKASTSLSSAAASRLDMSRWPATAIRMFLGEVQPEAVLALQGGEVTRCEALYFTAEYMFTENRKVDAVRLFKEAASRCPNHILEGVAAKAALRTLGE